MLYAQPRPRQKVVALALLGWQRIAWLIAEARKRRTWSDDDLMSMPGYLKRDLGLFDGELGLRCDPKQIQSRW